MSPKTSADLITARVAREREWCLEAWNARMSWSMMRAAANRPIDEGGLGYDLSVQALKSLVEQGRLDRGDLTMSREQRRERQLYEADERARLARADMNAHYRRAAIIDNALEHAEVFDTDGLNALARLAAERNAIDVTIDRTDNRLDRASVREAKLTGLDAATEVAIDVTHRDAVDAELNEMLARLDPPKKKAKKHAH